MADGFDFEVARFDLRSVAVTWTFDATKVERSETIVRFCKIKRI